MIQSAVLAALFLQTLAVFAPQAGNAARPKVTETEKIEHLIRHVEQLKGAVFIRNGQKYECADAAKHMHRKWKWKEGEIRSAEDFIRVAASTSSETGAPYRIRFNDGREVSSADYLREQLRIMTPER